MDVLADMAGEAGSPFVRLGAAAGALMRAVDATAGLLLHGGPDRMDVRSVGPRAASRDRALAPAPRVLAGEQPLLDRVRAGSDEVTTAARAFGPEAWQGSAGRRIALADWGVDQLLALPVRSGPDHIVFLLGRRGADFTDEDVALLTALRPAVASLAALLETEELLPDPDATVLRLTARESTVLALLADGHTAVRIAHLAGCSPRTVHHHLSSVYRKLGVRDRLSAVNRARELGIVQPELVPAASREG